MQQAIPIMKGENGREIHVKAALFALQAVNSFQVPSAFSLTPQEVDPAPSPGIETRTLSCLQPWQDGSCCLSFPEKVCGCPHNAAQMGELKEIFQQGAPNLQPRALLHLSGYPGGEGLAQTSQRSKSSPGESMLVCWTGPH